MKTPFKSIKLIAALIAAFGAQTTVAQTGNSVTLYGRVDLNLTKITAGPLQMTRSSNTRWGVRGSESLGNKINAIFQLESAFEADTGIPQTPFFREGWVGVAGPLGTARLGRSLGPAQRVASNFDPHSTDGIGSFGSTSLLMRHAALVYQQNALFYETPDLGGFRVFVAHQLDETVGVNSDVTAVSLRFRSQPLEAALAMADAGLPGNKITSFALAYDFGIVRPMVQWHTGKNAGNDWRTTLLGATAPLGPGKLRVAYSKLDQRSGGNDDRTKFAVGYDHSLSKRTLLYGTYARDTRVARANTNGIEIGMRHSF